MEWTDHEAEEEEDWLETLDALQSDEAGAFLETKSQDDPKVHRLLPLVGGVTFSSVKALPQEGTLRCYDLEGNVLQTKFSVIAKVDPDKKEVVCLETQIDSEAGVELDQVKEAASEMRSIPLLFRLLVSWADFDARRTSLIAECQEKYGTEAVKRSSADAFCIRVPSVDPLCSLQLSWTWKCSWHKRGHQELKVVDFSLSPNVRNNGGAPQLEQWVRDIRSPQGLRDLVACTGSCEEAIRLIVQVMLDSP